MKHWGMKTMLLVLVTGGIFALLAAVTLHMHHGRRPPPMVRDLAERLLQPLGEVVAGLRQEGDTARTSQLAQRLARGGLHIELYDEAEAASMPDGVRPNGDRPDGVRPNGDRLADVWPNAVRPNGYRPATVPDGHRPSPADMQTALRTNTTVLHSLPTEGPPAFAIAHPFQLADGSRWVITASTTAPPPPPQAPLARQNVALYLVLSVILAGLLLHYTQRQLHKPIADVGNALRQFAHGNLQVRLDADVQAKSNELAMLAHDFNIMAHRTEELLQTQRRLLDEVSHELRTPLSRVSLALELASRHASPEIEQFIERIRKDAEQLSSISSQLLQSVQTEHSTNNPALFDLYAMLQQLADDNGFDALNSNKRLVFTSAATTLAFRGVQPLLRSGIGNILQNAITYTPSGGTIRMRLEVAQLAAGRVAHIAIEDEGPGIEPEEVDKVFQPFYRGSRTHHIQGTGMGLAIARKAIHHHGGSITPHPTANGGLRMDIVIPADPASSTMTDLA